MRGCQIQRLWSQLVWHCRRSTQGHLQQLLECIEVLQLELRIYALEMLLRVKLGKDAGPGCGWRLLGDVSRRAAYMPQLISAAAARFTRCPYGHGRRPRVHRLVALPSQPLLTSP
jgi:hypothetical protein